ncbi:PaaX family transcriptional regulator [Brevibacterium limosum]|uniref:PaaX family transcriptional regulator n=1 Tax=Brevibacterium limosum TaxID=2697565 RepID=UPI00141E869E|nr:PaaX family transcriptional regulator C-terminal domain-containing protein [Brevibacterium limosum]
MDLRPQSLFFALVGEHLLGSTRLLSGASIVFVMRELGVGEAAARSVLQRMTAKGFVARCKQGRKTFYTLTETGSRILGEGGRKMFTGWRSEDWDGSWTMVRVQVPESRRSLRQKVWSQLSWAGFGQIDGGTWAAPGQRELTSVLDAEQLEVSPIVFCGRPQPPTADEVLVAAFELDALSAEYSAFGDRWQGFDPEARSPVEALVARVKLQCEWLGLTRLDPQLPAALLPQNWPGKIQAQLFSELNQRLSERESPVLDEFFAGTLE